MEQRDSSTSFSGIPVNQDLIHFLVACGVRGDNHSMVATPLEPCPICGQTTTVRPKLVLIDEAWIPVPGKDARLEHISDLRVDAVEPQNLREPPLEQFIEGFYCDSCDKGFVSEHGLKEVRIRYHR
jgi:hypothetical protein